MAINEHTHELRYAYALTIMRLFSKDHSIKMRAVFDLEAMILEYLDNPNTSHLDLVRKGLHVPSSSNDEQVAYN